MRENIYFRIMSVECVIFDMDGTLIDSRIDITNAVNFVRSKKGLPPLKIDDVVAAINGPVSELSLKFYNTAKYEKRDKKLFEEFYMEECTKNAKVYNGVIDVLEYLKTKNKRLAVATNAPTKFAEKMLKSANICHYFDCIKGCDGDLPPKPHPHILLYLLEKLNYKDKNRSLFIGDNESDFLAALSANLNYIMVTWGFGKNNSVIKCKFIVNYPEEVLKYIDME